MFNIATRKGYAPKTLAVTGIEICLPGCCQKSPAAKLTDGLLVTETGVELLELKPAKFAARRSGRAGLKHRSVVAVATRTPFVQKRRNHTRVRIQRTAEGDINIDTSSWPSPKTI